MTDHASALELDEAAAGLAAEPVRAHVAACESCRARLVELKSLNQAAAGSVGFQQTLARLPSAHPPRLPRRIVWAGVTGLFAAAALLLAVRPSRELRAKGSASLQLVNAAGLEISSARVGEPVEIKLAAGPYRYAQVVAIDVAGKLSLLWPSAAAESGALPPGGHVSLKLLATPGDVRVVGAFSQQPLPLDDIIARRAGPEREFIERELQPSP